jgi:hypothetical protein
VAGGLPRLPGVMVPVLETDDDQEALRARAEAAIRE